MRKIRQDIKGKPDDRPCYVCAGPDLENELYYQMASVFRAATRKTKEPFYHTAGAVEPPGAME